MMCLASSHASTYLRLSAMDGSNIKKLEKLVRAVAEAKNQGDKIKNHHARASNRRLAEMASTRFQNAHAKTLKTLADDLAACSKAIYDASIGSFWSPLASALTPELPHRSTPS